MKFDGRSDGTFPDLGSSWEFTGAVKYVCSSKTPDGFVIEFDVCSEPEPLPEPDVIVAPPWSGT